MSINPKQVRYVLVITSNVDNIVISLKLRDFGQRLEGPSLISSMRTASDLVAKLKNVTDHQSFCSE